MRLRWLRAWRYPDPTPRYVRAFARIELAVRHLIFKSRGGAK